MNQYLTDQEYKAKKKYISTFKGEPSVVLPTDVEDRLAAPFQFAIVGKFSKGRPSLEDIKKFIAVQNYTGSCETGLLDHKHVIFIFECLEDFIRLYSRHFWNIHSLPMRVFRWTKDFHVSVEPPFAPIWFVLPRLPVHLMNQDFMFWALSAVGKPLRLDSATSKRNRTSVARIQVEIDITKALPRRLWIHKGTEGFWQDLIIEGEVPPYCPYCFHMGHQERLCSLKFPRLGKAPRYPGDPKSGPYFKGFQDNALRKYRFPLRKDSHRRYLPQNTFVHNSSKIWRETIKAQKPKQQHVEIKDLIVWDDSPEPPSSAIVAHVSPISNGSDILTPEIHLNWSPDFDSRLSNREIGCSTPPAPADRSLPPLLQSTLSPKPSANPDSPPVAMGILFYNNLTVNPQKNLPLFEDDVQASENEERFLQANRRAVAEYSSDSSLDSSSHSSPKAAFSATWLLLPPEADNPLDEEGGAESDSLEGEEDGVPQFASVPDPLVPEDPPNGEI